MKNLSKYITVYFFFGFIFIVPIVTFITPDKKVNELENKILTQLPRLSLDTIKDKNFMNEFDKYTSDQFPLRSDFIELKNTYNYLIGQKEFRNIYISKNNKFIEKFIYNKSVVDNNITNLVNISNKLKSNFNINTKLMIIPTSVDFYKDELPSWAINDSQKSVIDYINSIISKQNNLSFYTPYDVLNKNKDDYIYFNTDHHWTQLGAKLAYEDMYNTKVLSKSTKISSDFYGSYYSKALLPNINGDIIYSYDDFNNFNIEIDFYENYSTLYDKDKLQGKNKYQYFLHGDPALAVIEGNKNCNGEILVVKDSYAHSFVPFLTSNYKKIHIVDPRYYNINYEEYLSSNNSISEVLFINNMQTFNSTNLFKTNP